MSALLPWALAGMSGAVNVALLIRAERLARRIRALADAVHETAEALRRERLTYL